MPPQAAAEKMHVVDTPAAAVAAIVEAGEPVHSCVMHGSFLPWKAAAP